MIRAFLRERKSWILFFFVQQGLILVMGYLDPSLPFEAFSYLVFLSFIGFILFFALRYKTETTFYHSLELENRTKPVSPFEQLIAEAMERQTRQLQTSTTLSRQRLEQEKEELLAWVHEVKTPMTAMQLMIERIPEPKLKASLAYEWQRVDHLLDQQLHQKRIEFIENDLYIENVNIRSLLIREIRNLQVLCMQKGIGFEMELEVTEVLSDAKWLSFIVRQLLTNAVKYSEATDITLRSMMEEGQTILEVEDRGRGIDARDLPRIFEKGYTSTLQHQNQAATGMGLYLARRACESLGIWISVESQLGQGTTMRLTFPRRNEHVTRLSHAPTDL